VIFIHLRDGVTQIAIHADADEAAHRRAVQVRPEYAIAVEGTVALRSADAVNPTLETGAVELFAEKIWILNESRTPPFPMEETVDVAEEVRLKYRYVDLRRPHMQRKIILRSKISFAVRECLNGQGFLEIETPFMTRSTPEGARDYLVPSRVQPGTFYALRQSPQIFKQLLMIAGFDKYFQIVRCFRDEDCAPTASRNSRRSTWVCQVAGFRVEFPFPRLTYAEAMRSYGSDKPDRRIPPMHSVEHLFPEGSLTVNGLPLVAIRIPQTGVLSRRERDELKAYGVERGLRVYDDPKRVERDHPEPMARVRELTGAAEDDLLMLAAWAGEPMGIAIRRPQ
jgi:aspartyl-tRNA synthetase